MINTAWLRFVRLAMAMSLVTLAAGSVGISPLGTIAAAQSGPVIHVATGGKETDAEVFYAQELGLFQKAGLNVDIQVMQNGAAIGAAIQGGGLQIGSSSTLVVARAHERGLPFLFIAPGGQYAAATPSSALVVPSGSPIKTAKDLNGKTVAALSLRGIDQSSVMAWCDENGGDSSTVKFVEITPGEMPAALERGTVDAAMLAEPFLTAARSKTRILGKAYESVAKSWLIAGWFSTSDWIEKNTATARKFADVMKQSGDWANANPVRAAAVLQKYSKLVNDGGRVHTIYGRTLDPATITPVIEMGVKYKVLTKSFPAGDIIAPMAK